MNKTLYILLALLISYSANSQNKIPKNYSVKGLSCKTCHICDVPTKQNPCLVGCPRGQMITVHQTAADAPDVIKIDILENKYAPVMFTHKIHSQMSQMAGGCASCHHFNNVGPILKCQSCHEAKRKREDISKPDLQGAFHRQCIQCHRAWSHTTDCTFCHALKSDLAKSDKNVSTSILNVKNHPEVPEPTKIVYETGYSDGALVTFFHDDHTKLFKINCTSCHKEESCNRCHDLKKVSDGDESALGEYIKARRPKEQQHKPCFNCHQDDPCIKCHRNKEATRFNHSLATGWPLSRFHEQLECSKCHGYNNEFVKLNNECKSCHPNFAPGKFNHSITGLELDENHKEASCTDCHQTKDFSNPICTNCHDDKSYPKDKPGKQVKLSRK
jgi:hypothetical protein